MQRDANNELVFTPFGITMIANARAINHGLIVPSGKFVLETGLFTLGHLVTNNGTLIQAAKRKESSFSLHLCTQNAAEVVNAFPLELAPEMDANNEIEVPDDLYNPMYNCHGHCFADSQYWINPSQFDFVNGMMMPNNNPNVDLILDDEYTEVQENVDWDVAVYRQLNGSIAHSVKRENTEIESKYEGYWLLILDSIANVNLGTYGVGAFRYYKLNGLA